MDFVVNLIQAVSTGLAPLIAILVFGIVMAGLAGGHRREVLFALVKVLVSALEAPFKYLRRISGELAELANRKDASHDRRGLYLMHRLLDIEKAVVLVVASGLLTSGILYAWFQLLPEPRLREQRKEVQEELEKTESDLKAEQGSLETSRSLSESRVAAAVVEYRAPRESTIRAASAEMQRLTEILRSAPDTRVLLEYGEAEVSGERPSSPHEVERTLRDLRSRFSRASWAGGGDGPLVQWVEAWRRKTLAELELAEAESVARAEYQQQIADQETRVAALEVRKNGERTLLDAINLEYRLRWGGFLRSVVFVSLGFALAVWLLGLLFEGFGLMIGLAGDVRELRHRSSVRAGDAGTMAGGSAP